MFDGYRMAAAGAIISAPYNRDVTATSDLSESAVAAEKRGLTVFGLIMQRANDIGALEVLCFLLAGLMMAGTCIRLSLL